MTYGPWLKDMHGMIYECQKSTLQRDIEARMARQRFTARVAAVCWAGVILILLGAVLWHFWPVVVQWAIPWATGR